MWPCAPGGWRVRGVRSGGHAFSKDIHSDIVGNMAGGRWWVNVFKYLVRVKSVQYKMFQQHHCHWQSHKNRLAAQNACLTTSSSHLPQLICVFYSITSHLPRDRPVLTVSPPVFPVPFPRSQGDRVRMTSGPCQLAGQNSVEVIIHGRGYHSPAL